MKNKLKISLIAMLIFGLSACAEKPDSEKTETDVIMELENAEEQYFLYNWELPDIVATAEGILQEGDQTRVMLACLDGEYVWRIARITSQDREVAGLLVQRASQPYLEWQSEFISDIEFYNENEVLPICFSVPRDGRLYLFYQFGFQTNEERYGYGRWSFENGLETRKDIMDESIDRLTLSSEHWRERDDGKLYQVKGTTVTVWEEDFSEKEHIRTGSTIMNVFEEKDTHELVWLGELDGIKGIYRVGGNEKILSEDNQSQMPSMGMACQVGKDTFYLTDGTYMWQYFEGKGKKISELYRQGFYYDEISDFRSDQDENPTLLTKKDSQFIVWKLMLKKSGESLSKKEITFAVGHIDPWLRDRVAAYNRQQSEYQIVFRLKNDNMEFGDFEKRLLAELSTGDGPDLMMGVFSHSASLGLAEKGAFLDLRECLEEENDFYEKIVSDGNGQIYEMPVSFQPWTLVAGENVAKELQSCTPENLMNAVRESGARVFAGGMSGTEIVNILAFSGQADKRIIDFDLRTCHLQDELFLEILDFAKAYQDKETSETKGDRFQRGEIAIEELFLGNMYAMIWADALTGGKAYYVGYPSAGGGYTFFGTDEITANAASKNLEGAKDFVGFLLSEKSQSKLAEMNMTVSSIVSYPVRKSSMEKILSELPKKENKDNSIVEREGIIYREDPLSNEQIKEFRDLLNYLLTGDARLYIIQKIASEELESFFQGTKSSEEVASILNNKIQLYLDEE